MRRFPEIGPAGQLSCRVELAWPGTHGLWWNPRLHGTQAQIAAALDELALRVRIDPSARMMLRVDPAARIRYHLEVSADARILTYHHPDLDLTELPGKLRDHATALRAHRGLPTHGR
ncbi:hypothetical protein ACWEKT_07850 [Nocardia takedensis]|uniref:hypothetical protein n=1 Tax=Nocardia takedensis TaxID=259390 RepID=UPI0002D82E75|nr:hypothetical protein [Nocardia takedensis]